MSILVTGVTGFIGSRLCKRLLAEGYEVCGLSHYGNVSRIQSVIKDSNFRLEVGDIRDANFIAKLLASGKFKTVFHLAAQVPYAQEEKDFGGINMNGTFNLIKASNVNGVEKFIYASSMSVYSKPNYLPIDEKHSILPLDEYGRSKLNGEGCCQLYKDNMKVSIMRFAGIYGVGSEDNRVIPSFIRFALKNEPLIVDGDGSHSSDFVYVEDIIQGLLLAWRFGQGVYNLGSGCETSIKELAKMIINVVPSKSKIVFRPDGVSRPFRFFLDIAKAQKELGYYPHSLKEGLGLYVKAVV